MADIDADLALAADTLVRGPDRVPGVGLSDRVVALNTAYPDWGATRIAAAIGRHDAYVRTVARRRGLELPRSKYGEAPSSGSVYVRLRRAAAREANSGTD
jgi:hypothetical protein